MRKLILIILLLCLPMAAQADDTLGVISYTGYTPRTVTDSTHYVGYRNNGNDTVFVWHTNSTDTIMTTAAFACSVVTASAACSLVVSVYDSATGTLAASSDTLVADGAVLGTGPHWVSGDISGNLSPNTAYKIGIQFVRGGSILIRPYGKNLAWTALYILASQGLTAPANLSGHAANSSFVGAAYIITETGGGGTWDVSQSVAFADTADTTVSVSIDYTLSNATITRTVAQWSYNNFSSVAGADTESSYQDPDTMLLYVNEHDSVWVRTIAEDDDSSKSDTSSTIVVQTFYTISHSLSSYNVSYNSFKAIDDYIANTVTKIVLLRSTSVDMSGAIRADSTVAGITDPDSLDGDPEDTLAAGQEYYFQFVLTDTEMGTDTSGVDSVTTLTIISLDSIIVSDTNSTSITLLTWLSDYNTGNDTLYTYVSADSDSVAGLEAAVRKDTALVNASDSISNSISGLTAGTEYFYIQIVIDASTGLADTSVIASITTQAAGSGCDCGEVADSLRLILGDSLQSIKTELAENQDSLKSISTKLSVNQDSLNSVMARLIIAQDSLNNLITSLGNAQDSLNNLMTLVKLLPDTSWFISHLTTSGEDTLNIRTMMTNNAWGWTYGTRALTDKTGFGLASTGLNGVTQSSGSVIFSNTSIATVTTVTNKVTLVDSSAGDISYIANNPNDYKANVSNLDVAVSTARDAIMAAIRDSTAKAFSDSGFTAVRAGKLDSLQYLDQPISTGSTDLLGIDGVIAARIPAIAKAASDSTLRDSLSYQGSTSSLTAEEIAHAVGDTTGRGIVLRGSGDYACSLYVLNSADSSAIITTWVLVYSKDGVTLLGKDHTDPNGLVTFMLNPADSLRYYASKAGVTFDLPEYITIDTVQTDTIFGSGGLASGQTIIRFYVNNLKGDSLDRVITEWTLCDSSGVKLKSNVVVSFNDNVILCPITGADTTYAEIVEFALYNNPSITPANTKYRFKTKSTKGEMLTPLAVTILADTAWVNPFGL